MNTQNISFFDKVLAKLKKPFFLKIFGIKSGYNNFNKRCLVYMKTEPFYRKLNSHTNVWEIKELVRILNSKGFIVDIIDREVNNYTPKDIYDLFIGYGSGNSGKHFYKYAISLNKAIKILYATGPEPSLSNKLVKERYDNFNKRTKSSAPYMRTTDVDINKFVSVADYIFCIGEENGFSMQSYAHHNVKTLSILPSTLSFLEYKNSTTIIKDKKHFLCFAGSGLICKGVDIIVEAFKEMPEYNVHICGPEEKAFNDFYKDTFLSYPNINYYNFVDLGGNKYKYLSDKCSFTILNSAAEGCATSILNNMRSGLIPIINYETGIDIKDFGFLIDNNEDRIDAVKKCVREVALISDKEYIKKRNLTLEAVSKFTKKSYSKSMDNSLNYVLNGKK